MVVINFFLIIFLPIFCASAKQTSANDHSSAEVQAWMDAGVESFKAANHGEAVDDNFRKATQLAPNNEKAHAYLGTAYAYEVVPNLETPENLGAASSALAEFEIVLKVHPDDLMNIRQEASVYRNIKQFDPAKALENEQL
jgi:Tfp pilus assembly protein PilF